jgi:hypothetical protein
LVRRLGEFDMTVQKADVAALLAPRLVSRAQAAARVGLSPNAFDREVRAGTFPGPFPLRQTRRNLWDVRALDAVLDRAAGLGTTDDREARKRAWQASRQSRP